MNERIEVRRFSDGLDEIVVRDSGGKCVAHLEKLGDDHWMLICYAPGEMVRASFYSKQKIESLCERESLPEPPEARGE